jgi:hypothetical protein
MKTKIAGIPSTIPALQILHGELKFLNTVWQADMPRTLFLSLLDLVHAYVLESVVGRWLVLRTDSTELHVCDKRAS